MILKDIHFANYRGFEQLEVDFHAQVTVIAGVNGVGKSGVFRALATLFSQTQHEFTPTRKLRTSRTFTLDDIKHGSKTLQVSAHFETRGVSMDVVGTRRRLSEERIASLDAELKKLRLLLREAGKGKAKKTLEREIEGILNLQSEEGDQYEILVRSSNVPETLKTLRESTEPPIIALFTPHRHLIDRVRTLANPEPFEPPSAYDNALEERSLEMAKFMAWFNTMNKLGGRGKKRRQQVVAELSKVVAKFVPEFKNLRIEEEPRLRFVVDKNKVPLSLEQLSDGERGLLALLFDITRRLAIANPDLDDPIKHGAGLIMIDEIELHLHPKWQRDVLKRLTQTFKNCQFVITTHSPQVIGEVAPESVRILHWERRKVKCSRVHQSFGMDSNWILDVLMGANSKDATIGQQIEEVFQLLSSRDLEAAEQLIYKLRRKIGNSESLQRAASSLERIRRFGK